jgi:BMFP domain-containing protein YqiC
MKTMNSGPNRILDELAKLMTDAAGAAQGVRREAETAIQAQLERLLNSMDLVKREEFEAVREMAVKAREENDALAARLAELEEKLASKPASKPASKTQSAAKPAAAKRAPSKEGLTLGFAQFFLHRFSTGSRSSKSLLRESVMSHGGISFASSVHRLS